MLKKSRKCFLLVDEFILPHLTGWQTHVNVNAVPDMILSKLYKRIV